MKHTHMAILAGIAILGTVGAGTAQAQVDTTARPVIDSTVRPVANTKPADSVRKVDAAVSETPSEPKPEASETKSPRTDLRELGKVDGSVRLRADLSSRTLTVMGQNGVIRTFNVAVGSPDYPTPTGNYTIRKIVW